MADNVNTDFTLPRDAYATFDALTLKQHIKDRLNQGGVFTDQNFEGSNLSSLIDIIAFSYHLSLFYLNQTSSEALFDEASIFENINRITKLIGYKPTGYKTSVLSFNATASELLPVNIYTVKRFSYFNINGLDYSFIKDATFSKTVDGTESLTSLSDNTLLYQGKFFEHPVQNALGQDFEVVPLVVKDNINDIPVNIEHDSINVFVRRFNNNKYVEFIETDSVFNEDSSAYVFEKRLNENGFYELKFGNGVNGVKLAAGDSVYIYYLKSDGSAGKVSANKLNGNNLNIFTTSQFETISQFIYDVDTQFLTQQLASNIAFVNQNTSTEPAAIETVDQIKTNAPKVFYSQNRIVTTDDFMTYVKKNFANIVASSTLVNNETYIDNVIKYYYDLGLDRPNDDSRVVFNQVKFATTSQMNHAHAYMVPLIKTVDSDNNLYYLTQSQKAEIINGAVDQKMINAEIIPHDPVYTGIGIGLELTGASPNITDLDTTYLVVERLLNDRISIDKIQELVANIFKNYLSSSNVSLGFTIDINDITSQILSIPGVRRIITRRVDSTGRTLREIPFINLYNFNAVYTDVDINSSSSNVPLPFFKYPFLWNGSVKDRIIVETVEI
jgi:hypothetical protein